MKRIIAIIAIVSALLFSCVRQQEEAVVEPQPLPFAVSDTLMQIDSLLQHDADSALIALFARRNDGNSGNDNTISTGADTCQPVISTEADRRSGDLSEAKAFTKGEKISSKFNSCYHSLLLSEALYKTGNPQLNRFRNETMHYFDSLAAQYPYSDDIVLLSARSHYMNGVGFYENDSVVEACQEYLHTLEIMENHFDVDKLTGYKAKFMGLTYTRLGRVYYDNGIANAALDLYKNALYYFKKVHDYSLANTYKCIGSSYHLNQQIDSALYYYRRAIYLAKEQQNLSIYGSSLSESSMVYYDCGYIDSAFFVIKEALGLPTNEDNQLARFFTLGFLYQKQGECDSAIHYLAQSVKRNSFATQTASAELLMNCYQAQGDTINAQYYKDIYADNFTTYRNNSVINTKLTKLYEEYETKQIQNEKQFLAKQQNKRTVFILSTLLTVIIVITFVYKLKVHKAIIKTKSDIADKDKELHEMKRKMESNPFIDEPICKNILDTVHSRQFKSKVGFEIYKEFALSKEQLLLLRDAADRHYDNYTQRLQKEYPELSNDDIDYCCLYLLGLKDAEVSALMQKDYSTVCRRRRKLTGLSVMDKILVFDCNTIS